MAQDKLWVNSGSGQLLDFNSGGVQATASQLPTDPGPDRYHGQTAQYSENAQYDANGQLLFFVQDGNIYDHAGYLMADNDADPQNCRNCLVKGLQEILITPMPGTCDKYYIIGGNKAGNYSALGYSILDLAKPNPFFPGRLGAVWDLVDVQGQPVMDQQMQGSTPGITLPQLDLPSTCHLGSTGNTATRSKNAHLCILDGPANGEPRTLFVQTASSFKYATISANGISNLQVFRTFGNSSADDILHWSGGIAVAKTSPDGVMRLARTINSDLYPASAGNVSIEVSQVSFTGNQVSDVVLASINTDLTGTHQGIGTVHGIAFSPSGRYLYFSQATQPYIGYVDMLDPAYTVHDLVTELGLTGMSAYGFGQIACNKGPNGNGWSMYYPYATGMGCLNNIENPASLTWTYTLTVPGGPVAPPPNSVLSNTPGTPFNHYLMDRQNYRDQQVYNLGQDDCCQVNERVPEGSHANTVLVSNTMSTPWTPAANGLVAPNSAHVYFAEDFVVPTGVKLYVSGMDWHFGPDARLIVNRGSYVRFTNCTLQGSLDEECEPQRWPGVRVEGTSTADQQPPVNGDQGYLSLNNSVIKDAVVGVWCARESSGGGSGTYGYYGGIVVDNGSTFQNCITGVKIEHYNGFSQLSNFTNTYFVTDSNWPGGTPMSHANISYTKTVYFTNCRFANTTPYHTASNGIGVYVFDGQVYINGGAYSTSYFDNLYIGVANLIGVLNPSTVNHMDFRNNQYGIYDMGSRFARYTNNSFTVPDMFLNQPPVGLYLWQSQLYTVERNVFNGTPARNNNVGIYFLGYTPGSSNWAYLNSRIYDNQFQDLRVGTLVKHIHRGNGAGNEQEGLSLFCGDYTHNIADIALLASSIIRSNQGYPSASPPQLSGNRFLDLANCTNNWDWFLDPQWNSVIGYPSGMTTTVFRNEDPLCDVLCDSWPYFFDVEVLGSGPWSTSATCGYGDLDDPPQFQEMRANYAAAKSGLEAAENTYNSNLDAGEKPDLMSLLTEAEPPMASNALRDALLANGPLSDDVLLAMVKHEPAMDPWHLTQVLVDNVKLNTGVIETARASGLLSPFYMGIVDDAQEGSGVTWKQVLEQEIGQHRLEKAHALSQLAYLYTTDSTVLHGTDSLRALLLADSDPSYHQLREEVRMASQDWTSGINEAATEDFSTWNGFGNYQDIQSFGANHGGHWSELTAGETASLREDVEGGEAGAAYAAAILWEIDSSTYVPTVEMPSGIGVPAPKMSPSGSVSQDRPRLALYPNPANTEAYLTWPVELKGDRIAVLDAQGRILLEQEVLGNGLTHLALQDLPMGFYKLVLRGSGLSSSFSIVR